MNFKYTRLIAGVLAVCMLAGCAAEGDAPLSSGDLPPTPPVTTTAAPETELPEESTAPAETEPQVTLGGPVTDPSVTTADSIDESKPYIVREVKEIRYSTAVLNIREEPDTASKVVGQFNIGDSVEVTGYMSNGWARINYNGGTAYVSQEFISETMPKLPEEVLNIPENYAFQSDDDYFFVVNKTNFLPDDYSIETDYVQGSYELEIAAAYYCKMMIKDAQKEGIELKVLSAYRTVEYQKNLFERNVKYRMEDGMSYEEAYYDVSINIAPPGGSEHNAGLAVDIIDKNHWDTYEEFENTPEFKWLIENCTKYGFILRYPKGKEDITGYIYEPWHYRYVGIKYAESVMASSLCLEEYTGTLGV